MNIFIEYYFNIEIERKEPGTKLWRNVSRLYIYIYIWRGENEEF